jgi:hypothetical protein
MSAAKHFKKIDAALRQYEEEVHASDMSVLRFAPTTGRRVETTIQLTGRSCQSLALVPCPAKQID